MGRLRLMVSEKFGMDDRSVNTRGIVSEGASDIQHGSTVYVGDACVGWRSRSEHAEVGC